MAFDDPDSLDNREAERCRDREGCVDPEGATGLLSDPHLGGSHHCNHYKYVFITGNFTSRNVVREDNIFSRVGRSVHRFGVPVW